VNEEEKKRLMEETNRLADEALVQMKAIPLEQLKPLRNPDKYDFPIGLDPNGVPFPLKTQEEREEDRRKQKRHLAARDRIELHGREKELAAARSTAILELPIFEGFVMVGADLTDESRRCYEVGQFVIDHHFIRATADPRRNVPGNTLFLVSSTKGRRIVDPSAEASEQATVFDRLSLFVVADIEVMDERFDKTVIVLAQVGYDLTKPDSLPIIEAVRDQSVSYLDAVAAIPAGEKLPLHEPENYLTPIGLIEPTWLNVVLD
jgi:hypothetical protein